MSHSSEILSLCGVSRHYGAKMAVEPIHLQVGRGEIVGLLGPNGAGKTTIISMILGVLTPSSGTIHIDGIDLTKSRAKALAHANFAAIYAPLPGNLTVWQNLHIFSMLYGISSAKARIEALLERFALTSLRDTRCGALSSGEQTRASLAKAMLNAPALLLLDEPTASLDPATAQDVRGQIRAVADAGTGVLWTSHNMREVEEVCDRVIFLSQGRILLEGDPKTLPARYGKETLEALFIGVAREPLTLEKR